MLKFETPMARTLPGEELSAIEGREEGKRREGEERTGVEQLLHIGPDVEEVRVLVERAGARSCGA